MATKELFEPLSKLLVFPLITSIIVPYIFPFRPQLIWGELPV